LAIFIASEVSLEGPSGAPQPAMAPYLPDKAAIHDFRFGSPLMSHTWYLMASVALKHNLVFPGWMAKRCVGSRFSLDTAAVSNHGVCHNLEAKTSSEAATSLGCSN